MNLKKQLILGVAATTVFTACTNSEDIPSAPSAPMAVSTRVNLNVRSFGSSSRVEQQAAYNTLNGYFFSQGQLTKQYTSLSGSGDNYTIELPDSVGTIFFVANPAADFTSQITPSMNITDFKVLTADQTGVNACPMTASLELHKGSEYGNQTATLIRSVARVDAYPVSDNVTITGITLNGVAQNGYYFAQDEITSAVGGTTTLTETFDVPLTENKEGVFYLYEQKGAITVQVTAQVNGDERTFTTSLPGTIERNHVYTLKVTSKSVKVEVNVNVADWEQGEDTVIDADQQIQLHTGVEAWEKQGNTDIALN